jgi:prepilin-type N-terminal cleavage/methylation domain-containing protein
MKRRGFTFIELLVCIAIIAILAAILIPVFARAREKARLAACMSNLKALGNAFWAYTADYGERTPPAAKPPIVALWPYLPLRLTPEDGGPYECAETVLSAPVVEAAGDKVSICYLFNRDYLGEKRKGVLRNGHEPLAGEGVLPSGVFDSPVELAFPHNYNGAVLFPDGRVAGTSRDAVEKHFSLRERTVPLPPGEYSAEELSRLGAVTVVGEDGKMEVRVVAPPPEPKAEVEPHAERGAK